MKTYKRILCYLLIALLLIPNLCARSVSAKVTTSPSGKTSSDPLVGRWKRVGANDARAGMVIVVTKTKSNTYEATVVKSATDDDGVFKINDTKWKDVKLYDENTYRGLDHYYYGDSTKKYTYIEIELTLVGNNKIDVKTITTTLDGIPLDDDYTGKTHSWERYDIYDASLDGWPVMNTYETVGNCNYYFWDYLINGFGNKYSKKNIKGIKNLVKKENSIYTLTSDKSPSRNNGSCFGMAITSMLIQQGYLSVPGVKCLSLNGYDTTTANNDPMLKSNSDLFNLVERYQLFNKLISGNDYMIKSENYIEKLLKWDYKEPLLLQVRWTLSEKNASDPIADAGHSLVLDPSKGSDDLYYDSRHPNAFTTTSEGNIKLDGYKRFYLYDPNYACCSEPNTVSKITSTAKQRYNNQRYIDINLNTGDWNLRLSENSDIANITIGLSTILGTDIQKEYITLNGKTYTDDQNYSVSNYICFYSLSDLKLPLLDTTSLKSESVIYVN